MKRLIKDLLRSANSELVRYEPLERQMLASHQRLRIRDIRAVQVIGTSGQISVDEARFLGQLVREAERDMMFEEYRDRVGELGLGQLTLLHVIAQRHADVVDEFRRRRARVAFGAVDAAVRMLDERQRGLLRRIHAAPISRAILVLSRLLSGALIALVSRHRGARVIVSEVNPYRVELLKSLGIRNRGVRVVSCPSCARQGFDVIRMVEKLEERLAIRPEHRRSRLMPMLCTDQNSYACGWAGSFGGRPQSLMNLPFGSKT